MSRVFLIHDGRGDRRLDETALPLSIGGSAHDGITLPDWPEQAPAAHIGLSEGHAFIQPAHADLPLFHNHEHLVASRWLKSGDVIEIADSIVRWTVLGDQVEITVSERLADAALSPPVAPPPATHRALPEVAMTTAPLPRGGRLSRIIALAMFIVLLLGAAFVLMATPVVIEVRPPPQHFSLAGFLPAMPLGGRRLMVPGSYRISAALRGYRALQEEIIIGRDGPQVFEFELEELSGRVQLTLDPPVEYRLFVDGKVAAPDADNAFQIPGGHHLLLIETQRYLPIEETLEVAGKGQTQQLSRVLQPAWANVRVESEPPGAQLAIDGEPIGATPLDTQVLRGRHEFVLTHDRRKPLVLDQTIEAGHDLVLGGLRLQALDGRLVLQSRPSAASVTVDGSFQGLTPLTLTLSPDSGHELHLSKAGHKGFTQTLRLGPDEERLLDVQLEAEFGIVFVTAQPADARLQIDGRDAGRATQRLRLTTRPHKLHFSKPDYLPRTLTVTPRSGSSQNVDVVLPSARQTGTAKDASPLPPETRASTGSRLRAIHPQDSFRMGASRREAGRRANESARRVQLTRPFYLGTREVSNAEFRLFRPAHDSGLAKGATLNLDRQPVVNVGWDDAARFCNWLSRLEGLPPAYEEVNGRMRALSPMTRGYRLPSEAEWAYVARRHGNRSERRYPWGGGFPPSSVAGNFADASIADTFANTVPNYNDGYRVAAPVGSFPARPSGFYDLGGNVSEWMHDYYAVYPGEAERLVKDPLGPIDGDHHVVRDASWRHGTITELRLSYRDYSRMARPDIGFRVARYMH